MSVRSTPSLLKRSGFLLIFIFVLFGLEAFLDSIYGLNKGLPYICGAALEKSIGDILWRVNGISK